MEDLNQFVPDVTFEKIPIRNLVSNQKYQRHLSKAHVLRAAENFDVFQINPVKVSRRDGINYVFNGQHTIEIVAMVSQSRDTPVWCMIYNDLKYEHEADIFANQMKFVKTLQPYEVFMANLEAGNDQQLIIQSLVESYSMTIGPTKAPGCICAVSTLESIYEQYGYHVLDRTLRLVIAAWEGDVNSFSSSMLRGVCRLIVSFGSVLRDEMFKEKCGAYSTKQISRNAKDRRPGSLGYAEALLIIYNGKCKNPPLNQSLLYQRHRYIDPDVGENGVEMLNDDYTFDDDLDEEGIDYENEIALDNDISDSDYEAETE